MKKLIVLAAVALGLFRPRIIFRPGNVVPNFDLGTSGG